MSDPRSLLAPTGRVQRFLENPDGGTLPASCTIIRMDQYNLEQLFEFVQVALVTAAGVNIHLEQFNSEYLIDSQPIGKLTLDPAMGIRIQDSMLYDPRIPGSWGIIEASYQIYCRLVAGEDVAIDLSLIRPEGTIGSKGQVASGPESFLKIYRAVERLAQSYTISNMLSVLSTFNEVIRRGGVYKNGAVTTSLPIWHPDFPEYATAHAPTVHPFLFKGAVIPRNYENYLDRLSLAIERANQADLWLEKAISAQDNVTWLSTDEIEPDFSNVLGHNVCLKGDQKILVREGSEVKVKAISEVTDGPVEVFNGTEWVTANFKSYGLSDQFVKVTLNDGTVLETTLDHRWILSDSSEILAKDLEIGMEVLTASVTETPRPKTKPAVIKSVETITQEPVEVFSGNVPGGQYLLANGIVTGNCREITLKSRGTCTIMPINLGMAQEPAEIEQAFPLGMADLCRLQQADHQAIAGIYLPAQDDRQVGLGLMGLANLLANHTLTYAGFTTDLGQYLGELKGLGVDGLTLKLQNLTELPPCHNPWVRALVEGFRQASLVAEQYKMDRAFGIAPTASVAYRYRDFKGFTVCPEYSPPTGQQVERISNSGMTESSTIYRYPTNVETTATVDRQIHFDLSCHLQVLMDMTGMGHSISFNVWGELDYDYAMAWLDSPLKATYYLWEVDQNYLDKSDQLSDLNACGVPIRQ